MDSVHLYIDFTWMQQVAGFFNPRNLGFFYMQTTNLNYQQVDWAWESRYLTLKVLNFAGTKFRDFR